MKKDINLEIEKLLKIKEEIDCIAELRKSIDNLRVLSQSRYDFLASKNLLKPDIFYYIAPMSVKPYVEDFQG